MRILPLTILFSITPAILTGCIQTEGTSSKSTDPASIACAGIPHLGTWYDADTGDDLSIDQGCRAISSTCESVMTFDRPNSSDQYIVFTVRQTNGAPGCLPIGAVSCRVTLYSGPPNQISVNCGGSPLTYERSL